MMLEFFNLYCRATNRLQRWWINTR